MPNRPGFQTLSDRRAACKHQKLIEICGWGRAHRFCLHCGEKEDVRQGGASLTFQCLVRGEVVHREEHPYLLDYDSAIALLTERLHVRGLFKEFDGNGKWLGDDDPHIVRGED